jgi:transcriptional regulator with XRE-family HTH domain
MRPSEQEFRDALRTVLTRSGLSMRALSAAMGRDTGYVAASLDPSRPCDRPTPEDLLGASDAIGIPFVELLETPWGIPPSRLARELAGLGVAGPLAEHLDRLTETERAEVADFAAYLAARHAGRGTAGRKRQSERSRSLRRTFGMGAAVHQGRPRVAAPGGEVELGTG